MDACRRKPESASVADGLITVVDDALVIGENRASCTGDGLMQLEANADSSKIVSFSEAHHGRSYRAHFKTFLLAEIQEQLLY